MNLAHWFRLVDCMSCRFVSHFSLVYVRAKRAYFKCVASTFSAIQQAWLAAFAFRDLSSSLPSKILHRCLSLSLSNIASVQLTLLFLTANLLPTTNKACAFYFRCLKRLVPGLIEHSYNSLFLLCNSSFASTKLRNYFALQDFFCEICVAFCWIPGRFSTTMYMSSKSSWVIIVTRWAIFASIGQWYLLFLYAPLLISKLFNRINLCITESLFEDWYLLFQNIHFAGTE